MTQFRATIKGNRGEVSRLGSKKKGITATIDGWNIGVIVRIHYDKETGKDTITLWKTGGSNKRTVHKQIVNLQEE